MMISMMTILVPQPRRPAARTTTNLVPANSCPESLFPTRGIMLCSEPASERAMQLISTAAIYRPE